MREEKALEHAGHSMETSLRAHFLAELTRALGTLRPRGTQTQVSHAGHSREGQCQTAGTRGCLRGLPHGQAGASRGRPVLAASPRPTALCLEGELDNLVVE